jgi:hypothetical protein
VGTPDPYHSLSPTPQEFSDMQLSHERRFAYGRIYIGLNYSRREDGVSGASTSEFGGFLRWSSW